MSTTEATEIQVKAGRHPKAWVGSEDQRDLPRRLQNARQRVLMLDYDGTLAPFHADKMQALPYPGVAAILDKLRTVAGVKVVLVTGRRAEDLEQLIDIARHIEIWGSHGREHISASREYTLHPPTAEQLSTLDAIQREVESSLAGKPLHVEASDISITSEGVTSMVEMPEPLERKPGSIAIHWRGLTAQSHLFLQAIADEAYKQHGTAAIERLPFASGVEFRAAGYTKAFAVEQILKHTTQDDVLAYLGDDITDEDAFLAMHGRGLSLLVRQTPRDSEAEFWIQPPVELLHFLEEWDVSNSHTF